MSFFSKPDRFEFVLILNSSGWDRSTTSKNVHLNSQLIANAWITPSPCVRDLGVMVDNEMTMTSHISHLTSVCYYHIRQLRAVRRSLTTETAHALVRALVNSRLDYCNGVLAGLPRYSYDKLRNRFSVLLLASFFGCQDQQVWRVWWERNCTGCLSRTESILQSCPRWRTNADTAVHPLIYPTCVSPVANIASRSHLRSAAEGNLTVPRTYTATFGLTWVLCFLPVGLERYYPSEIKDDKLSIGSFKNLLQTHYFSKSG